MPGEIDDTQVKPTKEEVIMAFERTKSAYIRAWVNDTQDEFTDKNRAITAECHDKAHEAEREFKRMLERLF
jgi:hypothetical protein